MPHDPLLNGEEESSFLRTFFKNVKPASAPESFSRVQRNHLHEEETAVEDTFDDTRRDLLRFLKYLPDPLLEKCEEKKEGEIKVPSLTDSLSSVLETQSRSSRVIHPTSQFLEAEEMKSFEREIPIVSEGHTILPVFQNSFPSAEHTPLPSVQKKEEEDLFAGRERRGKQPFYDVPYLKIPYFSPYRKTLLSSSRKKHQNTVKKTPSAFREVMNLGVLTLGLFLFSFVGFNFSSLAVVSEKYWNAEEYSEKQVALANIISSPEQEVRKVQALPVAGTNSQKSSPVPFLDLSVAPPDTRIIIPKIAKNIPIIKVPDDSLREGDWKQLEKDIQEKLKDGVVHYPGTAEPGDDGNSFITGHSSYYPWDPGRYKDVFAALHDLQKGDHYFIYHKGKKYEYVITERKVVKPSDTSVLQQPKGKKISTLMTCTPIGTAINRLIIVGEQVEETS